MSKQTIIRAWKDEEYRRGLSEAERARLPAHPAGAVELTAAELGAVEGGAYNAHLCAIEGCKQSGYAH
jgi:mersacidin/lichenicidin family type 2 lantibiotic